MATAKSKKKAAKKAAPKKAPTVKTAPRKYAPKGLLKPGTAAPELSGMDQNGKPVSLENFKGKKLVLYFYPEDDTPTCTVEACNLRDNYALLRRNGFEILGVSADDTKSHTRFIKKYSLPFPLLADVNREAIKAYKVWGKKQMFGKEYMGIHRVTYLISPEGKVVKAIYPVNSADHSAQIIAEYKV